MCVCVYIYIHTHTLHIYEILKVKSGTYVHLDCDSAVNAALRYFRTMRLVKPQ